MCTAQVIFDVECDAGLVSLGVCLLIRKDKVWLAFEDNETSEGLVHFCPRSGVGKRGVEARS